MATRQENGQQQALAEMVEPIAIIGIGCRLPGAVNSASKLWEFLRDGKTGQCKIPATRFNVEAFYHPRGLERPGSIHTMGGYFLHEDPRDFDPEFFGISPLEAIQMDPQQRKLLEVVYESFESAGITLDAVSGANIGCYVGNFAYDFVVMQSRDIEYMHRYSATGLGATILSNRISHTFNLKGPSVVLDTACSSSLYSLHVACSALTLRECDSAVVAGANLIQSPDQLLSIIRAGVLSPTSTCHTFSADADGYGRADGVGCLFIKRLSDAIRDNDPIRGVIRGTAVNSNGKTAGITLPSSKEQEMVIRKAYARAGLTCDETSYVECHGTGTPVGDPIEVKGLSQVFSQPCKEGRPPLLIGSVKTNFGHSEAASGLTSIMKTIVAMEHQEIPATVGVKTVNPNIKTEEWHVEIVRQLTPWRSTGHVRRAGINSFGYGGANAHAILDSAGCHRRATNGDQHRLDGTCPTKKYLLPLSAGSPASLKKRVKDLVEYMSQSSVDMADLAYTLTQRRTHLPHRSFILASEKDFADNLERANSFPIFSSGATADGADRKYVFVFTGQGAQWPEMGRSLFHEYPTFANAITEMDAALHGLPEHSPNWTLKDTILEPAATSQISHAAKSQPVCTALQVALVILFNSWGILPSAVVGHSSGEIAAAFAAGRISSAQAIVVAYVRGLAVERLGSSGAMMAAGLGHKAADEEIKDASLQGLVRVACVNSPESVTLSGDCDAVDCLLQTFSKKGYFARKLNTGGVPYHSHYMASIGSLYEHLLNNSPYPSSTTLTSNSQVRWVSSVTGEDYNNVPGAEYWRTNLENPVLFSNAIQQILKSEVPYQLIEIGPHSTLEMPVKQIQKQINDHTPYVSALFRFKDGVDSILRMIGQLYLHSCPLDWTKVNRSDAGRQFNVIHSLPPYPWSYKNLLWDESRPSAEFRHRIFPRHELLGSAIPAGNGLDRSWRNILKLSDVAWLESHKLQETIVFPGAGYIAMAIEAMKQAATEELQLFKVPKFGFALRNVKILAALTISEQPKAETELFTTLRPSQITLTTPSKNWWDFTIVSYESGSSITRATGTISSYIQSQPIASKSTILVDSLEPSHPRVWYGNLAKKGLYFGPDFQSIQSFEVPRRKDQQVSRVRALLIQDYKHEMDQYTIHPITLDAMLQGTLVASCSGEVRNLKAKVPVGVGEILVQTPDKDPTAQAFCHIDTSVRVTGFATAEGDAELVSASGTVVVQMNCLKMVAYQGAARLGQRDSGRHPMLRVLWKPDFDRLSILSPEMLSAAFRRFVASSGEQVNHATEGLLHVETCLDWISHKHSGIRVLELGNRDHIITNRIIKLLEGASAFPRIKEIVSGAVLRDGKVYGSQIDIQKGLSGPVRDDALSRILDEDHFDVVLVTSQETAEYYVNTHIELVRQYVAPEGGVLVALLNQSSALQRLEKDFEVIKSDLSLGEAQLIIARVRKDKLENTLLDASAIIIVERDRTNLGEAIAEQMLNSTGKMVTRLPFDQVSETTIIAGSVVISLLEANTPMLAQASNQDIELVKIITNNAAKLVWITSGDLLGGRHPEFSLVFGLSRAVMTEQPSLKWYVFDVDDITMAPNQTVQNVLSMCSAGMSSQHDDFEYLQKDGIVYVSRFVPDHDLNHTFQQRQGYELWETSLEDAKPLQLDITDVGNFDTIYFKQVDTPTSLARGEVQVSVKTVSLNAKDYYALGGENRHQERHLH